MPKISVEFVIVNDGSRDQTWTIIKNQVDKYKNTIIVGVNYKKNAGKGHAVRKGMLESKGKYVLMIDADGATNVKEISNFYKKIVVSNDDKAILIGSRSIVSSSKAIERPWYRKIPSLANNFFVVNLIGIKGIKDTQCGFKMFTRTGVFDLFSKMHLNRWAFDVELLYLALK